MLQGVSIVRLWNLPRPCRPVFDSSQPLPPQPPSLLTLAPPICPFFPKHFHFFLLIMYRCDFNICVFLRMGSFAYMSNSSFTHIICSWWLKTTIPLCFMASVIYLFYFGQMSWKIPILIANVVGRVSGLEYYGKSLWSFGFRFLCSMWDKG